MSLEHSFIITPRYEEFLLHQSDDPFPLKFLFEAMGGLVQGYVPSGRNSFTPTNAGKCRRRQVFAYLKMEKTIVFESNQMGWFWDGKWRHLRWQSCLRYIKVLERIEVPVWDKRNRISARLDGVGTVPRSHPNPEFRGKRFGFELKGSNHFTYQRITWEYYAPQVVRCLAATPWLDLYVIVIENKSTNEYREWVITREDAWRHLRDEKEEIGALNESVTKKKLPPMLSVCVAQKGDIWKDCPYGGLGGVCLKYSDKKWV